MKRKISIIIVITLIMQLLFNIVFPIASIAAGEETVTITCKDVNFYNGLKEQLGEKIQSSVDNTMTITMTKENVESVTSIRVYNYQEPKETLVTDITGIENFTNLTSLDLSGNNISDIGPLKNLINLTSLRLFYNEIIDISPIENLTNLKYADLSWNDISDITALSKLTNLEDIDLSENRIHNLEPFRNLTKLKSLDLYQAALGEGNIGNLSDLENLTNLTYLSLRFDGVTDIQPLSKLVKLEHLDLYGNDITEIEALSTLTNLNYLDLHSNNISNITALSTLINLNSLILSYNKVNDLTPLNTLINLKGLYLCSNEITDNSNIEAINELINLQYLDLSKNKLTDKSSISRLSQLINLKSLNISEINLSDISTIENLSRFVNLESLYISKNNIENINSLASLTNLEYLNLDDNNISDISVLSNLSNLTKLSLSNNNISDISALSRLTNLETLYLGNNNISDIKALKDLKSLTTLDLYNNNISDISALNGLANLTTLDLDGNNISDMSAIENIEGLSSTETKNQVLIGTAKDGVVQLPKIFKQAKTEGSKCYTTEDFELVNCTLNKDISAVTMTNKTIGASVKIKGGNADGTKLTVEDTFAPKLTPSYSTTLITNQDITAKITTSEPVQEVTGWTLSQDEMTLTKKFTQNSPKETVTVKDLVGNTATVDVEVTNIDKVAPKATVSYALTGTKNQDVKVTITADEKIQQVQGWQLSEDLTKLTKTYTQNSPKETIVVKDLAGNTAKVEVEVKNIDKLGPKAKVSYSTTELTNQNVVATITAEEEIQEVSGWKLSTDKKSLTKTYTKNVEKETVTIKDLAGNTTTVDVSIKNIDKEAPKPSISYTSTNTSATVTIKVDEKIQQVEGWRISEDLTTLTKTYTKNTQEEITIKDLAGNAVKVNIKVINIPENSNNDSQNQSEKPKVDSSTSGKELPYTGINYLAGIAIIATIIAMIYFKKLRNLKDIK